MTGKKEADEEGSERQAAVRGSAGDKAGPGCRTPHLGRGSDTHSVSVRGSCSVNQRRGGRAGKARRCLSVLRGVMRGEW